MAGMFCAAVRTHWVYARKAREQRADAAHWAAARDAALHSNPASWWKGQ